MTYDTALAALADPTRRHVFERLRSGPQPVGAIARGMPVSRPAVSQHLKVLKEALRGWLDQFWDEALAAFQAEAEISHKKDGER